MTSVTDQGLAAVGGDVDADVVAALRGLGLVSSTEVPRMEPLAGGVSSEIWRVRTDRDEWCVKRALGRLRVAAVWEAPLSRSHHEAEWMRVAGAICPAHVPGLVGEDVERRVVVMRYLPPGEYRLWKTRLGQGHADPAFARLVGTALGSIHAATADDEGLARRFSTDEAFRALRLEPYLEATARVHGAVAGPLLALSAATAATRRVLVHGDVSPKNILAGPDGPVFLDAECAWYGDPAFDLAFLLNHLLLKAFMRPASLSDFTACFRAAREAYLDQVGWEPADAVEARVAALLPGLLLARIDGKSPVEYITTDAAKARVRAFAIERLLEAPRGLLDMAADWERDMA